MAYGVWIEALLITTEEKCLRVEDHDDRASNLFLPTVCSTCESDEKELAKREGDKEISTTTWTSISISWGMMMLWQPHVGMQAYLEGDLTIQKPKVSLVQRDKIKDMVKSGSKIQSVLVNESTGDRAQVLPYLQRGFL